jgi:hypothetical protein
LAVLQSSEAQKMKSPIFLKIVTRICRTQKTRIMMKSVDQTPIESIDNNSDALDAAMEERELIKCQKKK